jgi:hypothetical protein
MVGLDRESRIMKQDKYKEEWRNYLRVAKEHFRFLTLSHLHGIRGEDSRKVS